MDDKDVLVRGIALLSSIGAYIAYQRSTFFSAILVFFTLAMVLWGFRSVPAAWGSIGSLTSPLLMAMVSFMAGFSYYAFKGHLFGQSVVFGLGTAFLGGALSMLLFKYWHMGPH